MMHITCFTESLGGGGAEHQLVLLAGMLAEKGYDVTIVTYASIEDHYDTPKGVMRFDIGGTCARSSFVRALVKVAKVFHYFLWVNTDAVIAYRECANLRVLPPMFFRSRKSIRVICGDRNTSLSLSFRHWLLINLLYHRADYIVPNSITETEFILHHKPTLSTKLHTIHNYTDLQQFAESPLPQDTSVFKMAIFSRFSEQKNPVGFAFAMKKLKQITRRRFEVHWYGSQIGNSNGFNDDYLKLSALVKELGIDDILFLHPAVKNPAQLMPNYHAICLASLYEGFSNSIAEGICCGKPMLVSDVSDNAVMVHEGVNGFLFNPKRTDSICDVFLKFFELSYSELSQMGKHSREIAEQLFDKDQFLGHYIDLIQN